MYLHVLQHFSIYLVFRHLFNFLYHGSVCLVMMRVVTWQTNAAVLLSICVPSSQQHGLVIIPDGTPNGDVNHEPLSSGITVVSQEAAQVLESAGEGPLGESET